MMPGLTEPCSLGRSEIFQEGFCKMSLHKKEQGVLGCPGKSPASGRHLCKQSRVPKEKRKLVAF